MSPAVQEFFDQIAEAYRSSPWEVAGLVLIIGALLGGLIIYATIWSRREKRQKAQVARELYEQKSRELKLTPEQHEMLALMAGYLKDPVNIYQLLSDEVAFNAAAMHMREDGEVAPRDIAALRIALGYQVNRTDRPLKSSAQIPENTTVLVARNRYKKPVKAKVVKQEPQSFILQLRDDETRLPPGAVVDIYFQNRAGVFTFRSRVLQEKGRAARLTHSEDIKRYQKRAYYRRQMDLPVHVYPFDEDKPVLSRFRDIGGGGASLLNTDGRFKTGDDLELRFTPGDEEIRLTASVMRLSENGNVMHVNYEHIRDGLRDRIYAAIFKPPKDEQEEAADQGSNTTP